MTDDVVQLPLRDVRSDRPYPFPQESELYFRAVERPLAWKDRHHSFHSVGTHKALLRSSATNGDPVLLNVVGSGYSLVQNVELFQAIEQQFMRALPDDALADVRVQDHISYGGAKCYREYIFPNMKLDLPSRTSDVAFRTIAFNAFGGGSVKMYSGAIDFFCTNGMIAGEFVSAYRKHSKHFKIGDITGLLVESIDVYYKMADTFRHWMGKELQSHKVEEFFIVKFGERMGAKLFRQFSIECHTHGQTVWAMYSAMTYYATHDEGEFKTRNTGNDHQAVTLLERERTVHRIVATDEFKELAA